MKRHFKKVVGGLVPAFDDDEQWLARIKTGDLIEVDVKRPRNQKLHRKWWALCSYMSVHSDRLPSSEHASKYLLIRLGYCAWLQAPTWKPAGDISAGLEKYSSLVRDFPIADSISFANMDDDTFNGMYSKACDLLCEIIPHVTNTNVVQVLAEFAGVGSMFTTTE